MGISRRAYAKRRGCTEKAIRDRISDGTIASAILPDGSIDMDLADRLLAEKVTAGKHTGSDLNEARRRKLAAGVALLNDEVSELAASVVRREDGARLVREQSLEIAARLFRIADDTAPKVAGKEAVTAASIIEGEVYTALTELCGGDASLPPDGEDDNSDEPPVRVGEPLGDLSSVELAALKASLEARRLEIRRALNIREIVEIEAIVGPWADRLSIVRNRALGIHVKVAPFFVTAKTPEAKRILEVEISEVVEELADNAVSFAELTAGRAPGRRHQKGRAA